MEKIGRYQIEHELGRGAMGVVYRAFDPAIGRRIAIKTIRLDELGDPQARATLRDRLLREAQAAGILSHPNIVTIYDISEDTTNAYIYMEYVEGTTLDSFARGMPTADLLAILEQTAAALDYAHAKGIVHRDIKPANLMLSGPLLKVTDFGVARLRHRDSTQSGALLGTPTYMSPEQIAAGDITGAADQYALGIVAYEFLSGVKPFENDNIANLLFRITQDLPPLIPRLSAITNHVLQRVLAKDPSARYPDCQAFVAALEQALGSRPTQITPVRQPSGDEPTIFNSGALAPDVPAPELPPFHLPPSPPASPWKPIAGVLFGAALIVAILWVSFGRARTAEPAPQPVDTGTNGIPKPSAAGDKIEAEPPAPGSETKPQTQSLPDPQAEPPNRSTQAQAINFTSNPTDAEILVDNGTQDRCPRTPCTLEVPPGSHQVTGRLNGFADITRSLSVPEQTQLHFEFEKPQGTVSIVSSPSGASIRIDGRDTGQKTPAILKLAPGKYTLDLVKENLPLQSQEVTVRNGVVQTLTVKWNQ